MQIVKTLEIDYSNEFYIQYLDYVQEMRSIQYSGILTIWQNTLLRPDEQTGKKLTTTWISDSGGTQIENKRLNKIVNYLDLFRKLKKAMEYEVNGDIFCS